MPVYSSSRGSNSAVAAFAGPALTRNHRWVRTFEISDKPALRAPRGTMENQQENTESEE
jgi:hypothetical protein